MPKREVQHCPEGQVLTNSRSSAYFVTLDREHFLNNAALKQTMPFPVGTPGDLLAWYRRLLSVTRE
jgi:hypothetical protein